MADGIPIFRLILLKLVYVQSTLHYLIDSLHLIRTGINPWSYMNRIYRKFIVNSEVRTTAWEVYHVLLQGIYKLLHDVLIGHTLTETGGKVLAEAFRQQEIPPQWSRLQNLASHYKSWSFTKLGEAGITIPFAIRQTVISKHFKSKAQKMLPIEFNKELEENKWDLTQLLAWIHSIIAKLIKIALLPSMSGKDIDQLDKVVKVK